MIPDALVELVHRLPYRRPFLTAEARARGVDLRELRGLVTVGLLRHPVRSVYYRPELDDCLGLRVAALRLVVPEDCVVTDRTAAWLWGATTALAPNAHLVVPQVSVFAPPGRRLRNGLVASGERILIPADITEIDGLLVTTPLRTACDLGRLLSREQALAGMDALAALRAFSVEQLSRELRRFRGYRGVIQARTLSPLVDPRAQSPGESVMRLRWLDAGLPRPECQVEIPAPDGGCFFLDMGLPDRKFGGEYDGEEFHGPAQQPHDECRRGWARVEQGWVIVVGRRRNVYGRQQDIEHLLRKEYDQLADPSESD